MTKKIISFKGPTFTLCTVLIIFVVFFSLSVLPESTTYNIDTSLHICIKDR